MLKKSSLVFLSFILLVALLPSSITANNATLETEQVFQINCDGAMWECSGELLIGSDNTIYSITDHSSLVQAIHPNGTLLWEKSVGNESVYYQYRSKIDSQDNLYITYEKDDVNGLVALTKDGVEKWNYSLGLYPSKIYLSEDEKIVYLSDNENGKIVALNSDDGSIVFEKSHPSGFEIRAISNHDDSLIVSTMNSIASYNGTTGEKVWEKTVGVDPSFINVVVSSDGNISFLGERNVISLDANGNELWRHPVNEGETMYMSIQVAPNNDVILPVRGPETLRFNAQGEKITIPHYNMDKIFFGKKGVYFINRGASREFVALDPTTWEVINKVDFNESPPHSTWGKNGKIYFNTHDGRIISIDVDDYELNQSKDVTRIKGSSRYGTAVEISKQGWETANTVIIARGDNYPDALVGTPLAFKLDAPILLTKTSKLPAETKAEIERLGATNVIILGGTGAVEESVQTELENMNLQVRRIAGKSRYETAALIAAEVGTSNTAVIAYGGNFPDALAVASYAAQNGYPILLTRKSSLPAETSSALMGVDNTFVIGGTGVIYDTVLAELPNPTRISGKSRFDTAYQVIKTFQTPVTNAIVATGINFPDALTGSVLAAKLNAPLMLVRQNSIPAEMQTLISEMGLDSFTILGGTGAVSEDVIDDLPR
ncbi:hypothetical protein CIB95_11900 [Lottiidibacillus patelloidae]|uniref:Pyrrolo-quinoline quinone repeat domain-containing protein n=1 Tax=Lottiidibacillus patelloidae TaxID=2670334 RepID=A0A263BSC2_9BACI|nr:cell wall-binding repeat-containing protein [Lottiidibacillus patelloidae]OZM56472.1 hypothetical protein CIB95_11900 [Lottiidibacillus patelloidae]